MDRPAVVECALRVGDDRLDRQPRLRVVPRLVDERLVCFGRIEHRASLRREYRSASSRSSQHGRRAGASGRADGRRLRSGARVLPRRARARADRRLEHRTTAGSSPSRRVARRWSSSTRRRRRPSTGSRPAARVGNGSVRVRGRPTAAATARRLVAAEPRKWHRRCSRRRATATRASALRRDAADAVHAGV